MTQSYYMRRQATTPVIHAAPSSSFASLCVHDRTEESERSYGISVRDHATSLQNECGRWVLGCPRRRDEERQREEGSAKRGWARARKNMPLLGFENGLVNLMKLMINDINANPYCVKIVILFRID